MKVAQAVPIPGLAAVEVSWAIFDHYGTAGVHRIWALYPLSHPLVSWVAGEAGVDLDLRYSTLPVVAKAVREY